MKRLFAMALTCMLALTASVCACAEDAETDWYTLEEGNTAITVRLPGNTKFGLDWKCEISAPEVMEQTGEEQLLGESEGVAGVPFHCESRSERRGQPDFPLCGRGRA